GLVGSASRILTALADLAPPKRVMRDFGGRRLLSDPEHAITGTRIQPHRALWELQQLLPTSTAYTCDIGDHMLWALHYLTLDRPDAFFLSSGLAAMGSSLGAAVGCKLADPDRPVVAVCGDGTISMAAADIADAVNQGLNIIYLVMNDGRYGMVENGHTTIFGRTPSFRIRGSIPELMQGLGARVVTVSRPGDILAIGSEELVRAGA